MKTVLNRALRLLACHAWVWTQRRHSEPQWANCLYLNSPPSELIAGTMNNNCETEPPGFESVPHHTQLYTMNGSSMQGQIVSLEAHHGELGRPVLKDKLARVRQSLKIYPWGMNITGSSKRGCMHGCIFERRDIFVKNTPTSHTVHPSPLLQWFCDAFVKDFITQ